jgi:hypothetical protein
MALRQTAGDRWASESFVLPSPGPWQVTVTLLIDDFTEARLSGRLVPE